jgi:hypothetical protein
MEHMFDSWQGWLLVAVVVSGSVITLSKRLRSVACGIWHAVTFMIRLTRAQAMLLEIYAEITGDENGTLPLRVYIDELIDAVTDRQESIEACIEDLRCSVDALTGMFETGR